MPRQVLSVGQCVPDEAALERFLKANFDVRITEADTAAVVRLSLRAWAPVFASFEKVLGKEIYRLIYPDWLASQAHAVAQVCRDHAEHQQECKDCADACAAVIVECKKLLAAA